MTTYLTDSEGKFIPATQRPDGTWRKARRVKDGYVPQEEVPLYESKGKKFSERRMAMYPPGYSPNGVDPLKKEREELLRAKAKKSEVAYMVNAVNAATSIGKEIRKIVPTTAMHATAPALAATTTTTIPTTRTTIASAAAAATMRKKTKSSKTKAATTINMCNNDNANLDELCSNLSATALDGSEEQQNIAKQLKKLRKKMREIEAIEDKLKSGELKKPEMDQLMKVKRKAEIQEEIERLTIEDLRLAANLLSAAEAATTNTVPPPTNATRR